MGVQERKRKKPKVHRIKWAAFHHVKYGLLGSVDVDVREPK